MRIGRRSTFGDRPARCSAFRRGRPSPEVTRCSGSRRTAMTCGSSREPQVPGGLRGKCGTRRPARTGAPRPSDRRHKMVGATMDSDDLLKRVRAIPGVMEASIMHGGQNDRLYVKVAAGDANPVNRRVHPLLEQYPDLGLLYEYEQAEPCGAYDAMDRAISTLTYRSPTGPDDPACPAGNLGRQPGT